MARKLDAHSVVGTHVTRQVEEYEIESETLTGKHHHLLTPSMTGIAVRYVPSVDAPAAPTTLVVPLRG